MSRASSGVTIELEPHGRRTRTAIAGTILVAGITGAYAAAMITLAAIGLIGLAAAALLPRRLAPSAVHAVASEGA